jgi:hypothetical protein
MSPLPSWLIGQQESNMDALYVCTALSGVYHGQDTTSTDLLLLQSCTPQVTPAPFCIKRRFCKQNHTVADLLSLVFGFFTVI